MADSFNLALLSQFDQAQESDGVRALRRCDQEIEELSARVDGPAWLTVLGIEDWEAEKRLLLRVL